MKKRRKKPVGDDKNKSSSVIIMNGAGYPQLRKTAAITPAQEAQHITFVVQGMLKRSRLQFLIISRILAEFKDSKRYADLHYKDIETYAEDRLGLGRASLYRYLQIYKWVLEEHPKWLGPKPTDFIPDFNDCMDLIWIEHKLKGKNLSPALETALKELEKKALAGKLKKGEVDKYRHKKHDVKDGLKGILSILMNARRRGAQLAGMPPDALTRLDETIAIVKSAVTKTGLRKRSHHL